MTEERERVFELANSAKEKGFKTRTVTTNFTNNYLLGGKKVLITDLCLDLWLYELQRWLRDTHSIEVHIRPFWKGSEEYKKIYTASITTWSDVLDFNTFLETRLDDCDTHEQSLEVALQEALKLI